MDIKIGKYNFFFFRGVELVMDIDATSIIIKIYVTFSI
jgi:hypothetical protein